MNLYTVGVSYTLSKRERVITLNQDMVFDPSWTSMDVYGRFPWQRFFSKKLFQKVGVPFTHSHRYPIETFLNQVKKADIRKFLGQILFVSEKESSSDLIVLVGGPIRRSKGMKVLKKWNPQCGPWDQTCLVILKKEGFFEIDSCIFVNESGELLLNKKLK